MLANALQNAYYPDAELRWRDAFVLAAAGTLTSVAALGGLYLAKSALGINLMPGPSPFHDLLYWMVV
jgi:hypothetical protein